MSKLKRCPFCGKKKSVELEEDDNQYTVVCNFNKNGCGSSGGYKDTVLEATVICNKRYKQCRIKIG